MNINTENKFVYFVMSTIQHYNKEKYWKRRAEVINSNSKVPKIIRMLYLLYIKRCDAYNCASMGTDFGKGAVFLTPPNLPHHLNGIIIGHNAVIGKNCTIFQQVTIEQGNSRQGTIIGDNCLLGKGCFIKGGIKIGNNVKVGANAVVTHDVPDNCTVAGVPAVIIKKK